MKCKNVTIKILYHGIENKGVPKKKYLFFWNFFTYIRKRYTARNVRYMRPE